MSEIPNAGTKVCVSCRREQSVLAFAVSRKHADQLNPQCRDCISVQNKRQYRRHHQIGRRKDNQARFGHNPNGSE